VSLIPSKKSALQRRPPEVVSYRVITPDMVSTVPAWDGLTDKEIAADLATMKPAPNRQERRAAERKARRTR
jgi:hypothetical protein